MPTAMHDDAAALVCRAWWRAPAPNTPGNANATVNGIAVSLATNAFADTVAG